MNNELRPLLDQYIKQNGRGNMVSANITMVSIVEKLVEMLDRPTCQCSCGKSARVVDDREPVDIGLAPEGIEDPSLIPSEPVLVKRKVGRPRLHR